MTIIKATKKPVTIEAIQWTGDNLIEVDTFIHGTKPELNFRVDFDCWEAYERLTLRNGLTFKTLESDGEYQVASVGDYIIKGVQGEFYPCKPDIFELTYDF